VVYLLLGLEGLSTPGVTGTTTIGAIFVGGLTTLAGAPCSCDVTVLYWSFCFPVFAEDEMVSAKLIFNGSNTTENNAKHVLRMITLSN
jgi:hypothetical protein